MRAGRSRKADNGGPDGTLPPDRLPLFLPMPRAARTMLPLPSRALCRGGSVKPRPRQSLPRPTLPLVAEGGAGPPPVQRLPFRASFPPSGGRGGRAKASGGLQKLSHFSAWSDRSSRERQGPAPEGASSSGGQAKGGQLTGMSKVSSPARSGGSWAATSPAGVRIAPGPQETMPSRSPVTSEDASQRPVSRHRSPRMAL